MRITEHSVHRRLATGAIVLALVVLGIYGLLRLPVNFLPDMTYPMIKVNIFWSGATPDEIERSVADPIERQMMTVDGLDSLESSSIEGMYSLTANFRYARFSHAAIESRFGKPLKPALLGGNNQAPHTKTHRCYQRELPHQQFFPPQESQNKHRADHKIDKSLKNT